MSNIGRTVLIERIVLGVLFLCFCLYADSSNRRVKVLESKCGKCDCLSAVLSDLEIESEIRKTDRDDFQYQIDNLKKKCADCGKCRCSNVPDKCGCYLGCKCSKDTCRCDRSVNKCGAYACQCGKKEEVAPPKFCRFKCIQIYNDVARFKWFDGDGGEHETRMSLEEFERWGNEHEND